MNTKNVMPEMKAVPVISFFTGGGFLDIGFEQAGFKVVWTNEFNIIFAKMYCYGKTAWRRSIDSLAEEARISDKRSIENISSPEILKHAFPNGKPKFFGVIGGPPCPDFSVGGKNKGGKGINGRLSKTYVRRICKIKPSFFVLENVPGLFKTKVHREFLRKLEHSLEAKGYCIDLRILNALELGVPQDRERLIMVGIKTEYVLKCLGKNVKKGERDWFFWPVNDKYKNAKKKYYWPEIVENGVPPVVPKGIPLELTVYSLFNKENSPSHLLNGSDCFKPYSDKFQTIREGDTSRKSFKKLHRYRYSPTVCYGHNEVHLHPWEKRRLSVREAMRIQGIPDSYALPKDSNLTEMFAIVSNGVPVPLAFEVAKSLKGFFEKGGFIQYGST